MEPRDVDHDSKESLHSTSEVRLVLGRYLAPRMIDEVCSLLERGRVRTDVMRPKISEERRAEMRTMARRIASRGLREN